jgi:hypothetical protein
LNFSELLTGFHVFQTDKSYDRFGIFDAKYVVGYECVQVLTQHEDRAVTKQGIESTQHDECFDCGSYLRPHRRKDKIRGFCFSSKNTQHHITYQQLKITGNGPMSGWSKQGTVTIFSANVH